MKENLAKQQLNDFFDLLDLFCLNRGCINRRVQRYQATGKLDKVDIQSRCGKCMVCSGEWKHTFLSLRKDGLISFFQRCEGIPCDATLDNLMKLVWKEEHWIHSIFDRAMSTVNKYNVEAMFLQLIAAELISLQQRDGKLK